MTTAHADIELNRIFPTTYGNASYPEIDMMVSSTDINKATSA